MKNLLISTVLMLLVMSSVSFAGPSDPGTSIGIWMSLDDVVDDTYSISVHRFNLNAGVQALSYDISVSEQAYISADYSPQWDTTAGIDFSNPAHGAVAQLLNSIRFDTQRNPASAVISANTSDVIEVLKLQLTDTTTPRWIVLNISNIVATDENGNLFDNVLTAGSSAPSIAFQIVPEPATMVMLALGGLFLRRKRQA